ncbi:hypothetical protein [Bacillus sp. MRMR6]|nr:hypothetical protein [Bacillus sp. MRMR6]
MRKILTGIAVGLSITAANYIFNKNKDYSDYVAKVQGGKNQKWIHIK